MLVVKVDPDHERGDKAMLLCRRWSMKAYVAEAFGESGVFAALFLPCLPVRCFLGCSSTY